MPTSTVPRPAPPWAAARLPAAMADPTAGGSRDDPRPGSSGPGTGPVRGLDRGGLAMFGTLTGIATTSALCVAAGVGAGWLLDNASGAPHVFVFLGLAVGVAAAVFTTRHIVKRFFGQ